MLDRPLAIARRRRRRRGARRGAARRLRRRGRRPGRGLHRARDPARSSSPTRRCVPRYRERYARYRALYPAIEEARTMTDFFKGIEPVPFKGPDSDDPLAFRYYEPDRMVLGKRMEDQLRLAVAYWHSFAWEGGDPFGGRTFERPWFGDGMERREAQGRGRLRDVRPSSARRSSASTTATSRPRARRLAESEPQRPRDRRHLRPQDGGDRRQAALGHREPLLQPPLHGRRRDQPRSGRLRLCRGAGEERARRHPRAQAARTTCSGAAARATRRCSTPT